MTDRAESTRRRRASILPLALLGVAWGVGASACGDPAMGRGAQVETPDAAEAHTRAEPEPAECLARADAPTPLPNVLPEHRRLDYWLARVEGLGDMDAPLMSRAEITGHNREMLPAGHVREGVALAERAAGRADLLGTPDPEGLRAQLERRFAFLAARFKSGKYVNADGSQLPADEIEQTLKLPRIATLDPELRVALTEVSVRCSPRADGYYTPSLDLAFDRNLCTTARAQEVVQVLARWSEGQLLARTSYALGWVDADAPLSPRLDPETARAFLYGPYERAGRDASLQTQAGLQEVARATRLPRAPDEGRPPPDNISGRAPVPVSDVLIATGEGVVRGTPLEPSDFVSTTRPLTRRALLTEAFSYLGDPYGWGGYKGGRDCSRFLLDVFASFGILLPRNSAEQAVAGAVTIEVPAEASEAERLRILDAANRRGVVLAHFPGHIMLYLGRDHRGVPMALHSFAEYLVPCEGRTAETPDGELETLTIVGEVTVSDLELGRGSSRTAFIERIDRLAVFGR